MRYVIPLTVLLVFTLSLPSKSWSQKKEKWAEMESFHEVMGKTFHSAEKGNMEPVKTRSAELVSRAIAWKNSTPPAGYNKKAIKKSLRKLIKQAKEVDKAVKKSASDKDITEKLNALHDTFHEIMEECED